MKMRAAIACLAFANPGISQTLTLDFPAMAAPVTEKSVPHDSYFLPLAPFADGPIAGIMAEGQVRQQSWKIGAGGLTTLQILAPLREQLETAGYTPIFECEARTCGGFDFRYQIDVLPEPDMHVNLGDYRYLTAKRVDGDDIDYASLIVSRSANAGFAQLTRIGKPDPTPEITASTKAPEPSVALPLSGPVGQQLETKGYATLDDLTFKSGSSQLGDDGFASLADLARYLAEHPERKVVLVGHTDAEGALGGNIALSRKRAAAVAARLVDKLGVAAGQVSADGVGYLAPRSSNLTDSGRAQNRRVEVILSTTK